MLYYIGMSEGFNDDQAKEYLYATLEVTLQSPEHFIIMGRKDVEMGGEDVIMYDIAGTPTEDVMTTIEGTINEVV